MLKRRILLAEDDSATRRLIVVALRKRGYEVVEAGDGAELLECLEHPNAFSAIVADDVMPKLSGLDVLSALTLAHWQVPFVLITAYADRDTHAEAHALGVAALLEKPFAMQELEDALRRCESSFQIRAAKGEAEPSEDIPHS